jgi:hypothetical protein
MHDTGTPPEVIQPQLAATTAAATATSSTTTSYVPAYRYEGEGIGVPDIHSRVNMSSYLLDSRGQYKTSRFGAFAVNAAAVNRIAKNERGAEGSIDIYTLFFNTTAPHALPVYLSLMHNLKLRSLSSNDRATITAHSHPWEFSADQKDTFDTMYALIVGIAFACKLLLCLLLSLALTFSLSFSLSCTYTYSSFHVVLSTVIPATFAAFVVKERHTKAKHIQFISGVRPSAYWLANYGWDLINYLIPSALTIVVLYIFSVHVFTRNIGMVVVILLCFGVSVIPYTYILSFFFKSDSTAQNVCLIINFMSGYVFYYFILFYFILLCLFVIPFRLFSVYSHHILFHDYYQIDLPHRQHRHVPNRLDKRRK